MYAITGITGQVGGVVARTLLGAGRPVRAVVRDARKGTVWQTRGCELALAEMNDAPALTAAFAAAEGVFVLLPSSFDPSPGFPETRAIVATLQLGIMEEALGTLPMPVTFLRPAWYMENAAWDLAPARASGVVPSFLQPLDKRFPMVATADVGRVAAELLQHTWSGRRIVELEGPRRISPNEIAAALSEILGRPVRMEAVPRATWAERFRSQGMKDPTPRMQMLDGFNQGWIEFEGGEAQSRKGQVELGTVLRALADPAGEKDRRRVDPA